MIDLEALHIGTRLRDVRRQRGCSLQSLADQTGLSRSLLGSLEHNRSKPTLEMIIMLVQALDVSMDYLVLGIRPQMNGWGLILRSDDELEAVVESPDEPMSCE